MLWRRVQKRPQRKRLERDNTRDAFRFPQTREQVWKNNLRMEVDMVLWRSLEAAVRSYIRRKKRLRQLRKIGRNLYITKRK